MSAPPHLDDAPTMVVRPQTPIRVVPTNQDSYTHLFRFTLQSPRASSQVALHASSIFFQILHDCSAADLTIQSFQPVTNSRRQSRPFGSASIRGINNDIKIERFYRALYINSPNEIGRANLVRIILHGMFCPAAVEEVDRTLTKILPFASSWSDLTADERQPLFVALVNSARDLLFRFFVPLMAEGGTTAPASAHLTPNRDRSLATLVKQRDGHRCVVSGMYDLDYLCAEEQAGRCPPDDDDGGGTATDVAHIIPHALNIISRDSANGSVNCAQQFVWGILNMFDTGVRDLLAGSQIDNPCNALLLAHDLHIEFGKLHVYFEEVPGAPNSYRFKRTRGARRLRRDCNPHSEVLTFTNCEAAGPRASLPSPRLLKLHAACCRMLEMAGAAEYVEHLLDDLERMAVRGTLASDGSSDVGVLWSMRGMEGSFFAESVEVV